jgi:hypothetical protein
MTHPIDSLEIQIYSDTGDMDMASEIGQFLREALREGLVNADQIHDLIIVKTFKENI